MSPPPAQNLSPALPPEDSDLSLHSPERTPAAPPRPRGLLTLRVVLLALLLIPLNAWWLTEIEYVRYSDNATTQAIFFNAVTLLLVLLALNGALRRCAPRWRLSSHELVSLYVITAVASNLAGHDMLQILFTTITYVVRYETPQNNWATTILPYVPQHLIVTDKQAVDALYIGNSTLYRWDHVLPWITPIAWWTLFVMLVVWTMLCLTALFRKQWDAERLAYPIAEIPIQVITQTETLFRSRLLWGGFAVGAAGQIVNFIHALYPSFPGIPIGVQYFTAVSYPWNAAGPLPISSFPFAFGLTFLLPTQLGFSCWFFFLVSRVELVGAAMMGYTEWGRFPYVQQQGVGAIFGVFAFTVYAARSHIARMWQSAIRLRRADGDRTSDEPELMSDRTIIFGLILGFAGLILFSVHAGMRWQTAALFMGILFVIVVVVARLRAELGLPTYELYQVGADQMLQRIAGTNAWTRHDLSVMTLFFWLVRTHRQFPMQTHVDAARLGKRTGARLPTLTLVILAASLLGTLAAFWAYLHTIYGVGFESAKYRGPALWAFGREPWQKLEGWISSPQKPDYGTVGAYFFGFFTTIFLAAMRARFVWWPFHPAGYLVSGSFGLFRLWLPIFVSWLIKSLILRYGGLRAYRQALPFFLGLILGEFSAGFLRTALDLLFGLHLPPESGIGGL
jgi:hypothetical protein